MKLRRLHLPLLLCLLLAYRQSPAQTNDQNLAIQTLSGALKQIVTMFDASPAGSNRLFSTRVKLIKGDALPKELVGEELSLALQPPDRLLLSARYEDQDLTLCRDQQELWINVPLKKIALLGKPTVPKFATNPSSVDATPLGPLKLPIPPEQLMVLPLLVDMQMLPDETVGGAPCKVLEAVPKAEAVRGFNLPRGTLKVWARQTDLMPLRLAYTDQRAQEYIVELLSPQFTAPWPDDKWKLTPTPDERVQEVARVHLTRFLNVALRMTGEKIPTLGPATGQRRVVAREGNGRLELVDGTRVLYLKGTPEEMGRQHGTLLKKEVRELVEHILYGVGVGSSFEKGRWFFGEIEAAQQRLTAHMDPRYYREMDALADAAGLPREDVRLSNFFPELFHCSGFAVFGAATQDGKMYHGRVLDYLRGMGLEQNAVVIVSQPDQGNAWVNVSYAGFVGSVTAMNEKQIAIGEMGGRGEGNWDGKPMAQLVREVMEKATTLEEAIEIMRKGPRTCEYYYVISDAKAKRAVGIAATPDKFETIWPGQSHPRLPHAVRDAVLLSADDRYEELTRRVEASFGKIDAQSARDLMTRPVCMKSNIHSVLFAPDTLDFWVANADSDNPAAHTRYTHYNLREMLMLTGSVN